MKKSHQYTYTLLGITGGACFPLIAYFFYTSPEKLFLVICTAPFFLGILARYAGLSLDNQESTSNQNLLEVKQSKNYASLPEGNPWPVFQLDQKLNISFSNKPGSQMFGIESPNGQYWPTLCPGSHEILINSEIEHKPIFQEVEIQGKFFYLAYVKNKETLKINIYGTEMTEIKQLQYQIAHKSKLSSIGEMAAGVGHEINNPLSIIIGNISLIEKLLNKGDFNLLKMQDRITKVKDAQERIRIIVDGLRTFARSDSKHNEIVSVKDAVIKTVRLINELYEKDGIDLIINNSKKNLCTIGNLGRIQQIIMNLISNAKDAIKNNKLKKIEITLKEINNSHLELSVSDNGSGIPKEIQDKIFEPFFTTKGEGVGTGIGLGLVGRFIKEMHGDISVQSNINQGTKFIITLPSVDADNIEYQLDTFQSGSTKIAGKALVIDDEADIRDVLTCYLEDMGISVDEAYDGLNGLEKVKLYQYDYIFTDMKMPRMSGDAFIIEAKKILKDNTKIIIITGGVNTKKAGHPTELVSEMADALILKPFSEESIHKVLQKLKNF